MTTPNYGPQLSVDLTVDGLQMGGYSVPLPSPSDPLRTHHAPLCVLRQGEGPVVCLMAGVQAGDVTGTTVLQTLLRIIDVSHICGTLILCPSMVPAGSTRPLPADQYEYVKHAFTDDVLAACDVVIELGSGAASLTNTPHVSVWPSEDTDRNAKVEDIMMACGAPDSVRRFDEPYPSSMAAIAEQTDTPYLRLDLGRYGSTDKMSRLMGVSILRNALLHLGVLNQGQFDLHSTRLLEVSKTQCRVLAPTRGLVHWHVEVGGAVHLGNPIAEIVDPHRPFATSCVVDARMNGVLLSKLDAAICSPEQLLAIVGDEVPH